MSERPDRPKSRQAPRWVFEGMLIVVSAAVGFGVAQFAQYREDRQRAARALASLAAEVQHNLTALEPLVPVHSVWVGRLASPPVDRSVAGLDIFFETRPALPESAGSPFPFLRRSAWDAAIAAGALRLIPFETSEALSEIYRVQEIATSNVNRLAEGPLSSIGTFDPATRDASVRLLWMTLTDIHSIEATLLELYKKHLPAIQQAAARQR